MKRPSQLPLCDEPGCLRYGKYPDKRKVFCGWHRPGGLEAREMRRVARLVEKGNQLRASLAHEQDYRLAVDALLEEVETILQEHWLPPTMIKHIRELKDKVQEYDKPHEHTS